MAVPTILQHPRANIKALENNIVLNAQYPVLSLQVICADEFLIEQNPVCLPGYCISPASLKYFIAPGWSGAVSPSRMPSFVRPAKAGC